MVDTSYRIISFLVPKTGRAPFTHVALRVAPPLTPLEVTSPSGARPPWLPAYTDLEPSSSPGPRVAIQGLALPWRLSEGIQGSVTFSGVSALTYAQVVDQINASSPALRAMHTGGVFYLHSALLGAASSLELPSSEAAQLLGLPVDTKVYGAPPEARLLPEVELVQIANPTHTPGAQYQYRLTNPLLGLLGEWSSPFPAEGKAPPDTVEGRLYLQDNAGVPKRGALIVQLASEQTDPSASTFYTNEPLIYRSDSTGLVRATLVRGLRYVFSIDGARWVRSLLAPVDPTVESFSLLDPAYSTEIDLWALQTPELPGFYARRALG